MFTSAAQLLGTAATAYGVLAALTTLLQARQMLARGTSCEVSGRFFASYAGGYTIWLVYGLSTGNLPLITVDAVALSLRGSLLHPATWTSCTDPRPNPRPAAHPGPEGHLGWRRRPAPAQRTGDRRAADAGPGRVRQPPNDPAGLPGAEPA
jgi:uncharacterized protein with PQ loop repeat